MDLLSRPIDERKEEIGGYLAFGYYAVTLTDAQKYQRRETIDKYSAIAQCSVLAVLVLVRLFFFLAKPSGLQQEQLKSPSCRKHASGSLRWLRSVRASFHRALWWMKKDMVSGWNWGTRGEWLSATAWTTWLVFLCVTHTGKDYLHLTKRVGQIGAAQLPLQYLLAMRAPHSPVQWLTQLPHEQIKPFHQILGRIMFLLFLIHAVLYLAFFALSGLLTKRLQDWDVIWGIVCISLFSAISTTALEIVRRWNYRFFYFSHITIANLVMIPLYLHVSHLRIYVYEAMLIQVLHLLLRVLHLSRYQGTIKLLPGTNLVQVRIFIPPNSLFTKCKPGQHVYVCRPRSKDKVPTLFDQWLMINKSNPFTVASLPEKDRELLLVARRRHGNTKHLADMAQSWTESSRGVSMTQATGDESPILPFILEGPYGASNRLLDLAGYNQVLLVAGGVGATFIMPIYWRLMEGDHSLPGGSRVRCIWAVQNLAEIEWAFPTTPPVTDRDGDQDACREGHRDGSLLRPNGVEVYVTRSLEAAHWQGNRSASGMSEATTPQEGVEAGAYELQVTDPLVDKEPLEIPRKGVVVKAGRPQMSEVVEEVFRHGGSTTAVVCCGPKRLTLELQRSVEAWVKKGSEVFWHEEAFGW